MANKLQLFKFYQIVFDKGGYNSIGRVCALQAQSYRFKSDYLHFLNSKTLQAGFEPTSKWLTATCSTTELLKKNYFL